MEALMSGTVSTRLRDEIEEAIVTGVFAPGTRLDEMSMAGKYGVSRTPIREALMQLRAAGLVQIQPRRGATVTQIAPDKLVEMFEVMGNLEGMAARLAARRHTDEDRASILETVEACRRGAADTPDKYYYENERFHMVLYAASHNTFLIEECLRLHRRLKPYRRLQLRVRHRVAASLAEHEAIVAAILGLDSERAEKLARHHIMVQGERFTDLLASLAKLAPSPVAP